jgi:hypothetical protein
VKKLSTNKRPENTCALWDGWVVMSGMRTTSSARISWKVALRAVFKEVCLRFVKTFRLKIVDEGFHHGRDAPLFLWAGRMTRQRQREDAHIPAPIPDGHAPCPPFKERRP